MINELMQDCKDWISDLTEVMRNEREMQVRLAMYLKETGHYDNVHVEYTVPLQLLAEHNFEVPSKSEDDIWTTPENFPWHNQMYFDVMVEKDGRFAAVELKYATRAISVQPGVFYQPVPANIKIIKNQEASNLTMYNYWKDVHRIEALTHIPKVIGGVAIILTNNKLYWEKPKHNPAYSNFSTAEGRTVKEKMTWNTKNNGEDVSKEISGGHPNFQIDGSYECHWDDTKITVKDAQGNSLEKKSPDWFRYMITEVKASKGRNND